MRGRRALATLGENLVRRGAATPAALLGFVLGPALLACVGRSDLGRQAAGDASADEPRAGDEQGGGGDGLSPGDAAATLTLIVEPLYPVVGQTWNSYVANDGPDRLRATDAPCATLVGRYDQCIHAGELRRVELPTLASCTGLSMTDALGAFVWRCRLSAPGIAFVSTGLADGKGLGDLLTGATGWHPNHVTLHGGPPAASAPAAWWPNPVVPLPDNSAGAALALDGVDDDGAGPDAAFGPGTIFVLDANRASAGYNLGLDGAALVVREGEALRYNGAATVTCNTANGELAGANARCLVAAGAQRHLWLEGAFVSASAGTPSDRGIYLDGVAASRLHRVEARDHDDVGIILEHAPANRLTSVAASNNGHGLWLAGGSDGSLVDGLIANANLINGAVLMCLGCRARRVTAIGNQTSGVIVDDSSVGTVLQQALVANNDNHGLRLATNNPGAVVVAATVVNSGSNGLDIKLSTEATVLNVLSANNGYQGVWVIDGSNDTTLGQLSSTDQHTGGGGGVWVSASEDLKLVGHLITGNNDQGCHIDTTTPPVPVRPGIEESTCTLSGTDGSADYTAGQHSTAVLRVGRTAAGALHGKLTTGDARNASDDPDGTAAFPADRTAFDWLRFEHSWRGWGPDGVAFPDPSNRGSWLSGAGRLWDWRLTAADLTLRNTTGDGAAQNPPLLAGAVCPPLLHGAVVATDRAAPTPNTYLLNATELLDDDLGDEDGLCESHEACLYLPNFGAYQGHGDLDACTFDDDGGTTPVVGVTIVGYVENGVP